MFFRCSLTCLLVVLLAANSIASPVADWPSKQWEAIIVGAGPAGVIVASRLAAAGLQTLLIEGGGPSYGVTGGDLDKRRPSWLVGTNLTRIDVLGLYKSIFAGPGDLTCGSSLNAFSGCTIGGCSAINAGLFFEPPPSDYDRYFPAGWKAKDMIPATKRVYAAQPSTNTTSKDGKRYLQSGYNAAKTWLVDGLKFKETNFNARANEKTAVFGHPIFATANGQRGGPVISYLQKILSQPNFHLQSGTRVLRVERQGRKATGVTVLINGHEQIVSLTPKGRVVLSAGALSTPSLLMYSGIGPLDTLNRLSAAGKLSPSLAQSDWVNLPSVGAQLFDNPNTFIELQSPAISSYIYSYTSPIPSDKNLYLQNPSARSGPYTFASETAVFWDTLSKPDGSTATFQGTIDSSGYSAFVKDKNTITLNIYGTSGLKSSGRVVLDNNFIPGPDSSVYYSNPQDAIDISTFIHKIFQGLPAAGLKSLNIPATSSVEEIRQYITTPSPYARGQVNHWSSSCRIGSCVDTNLGVMGMTGLSVVDASVLMPLSVNPMFGVMVAAERGAEIILNALGKKIV